ncbi:MAG: DUF2911 domain-containing protein [Saprospiraceae bacterium]|nr:DUF2911 domain-containing protein [Saprospiraceae bacterium]
MKKLLMVAFATMLFCTGFSQESKWPKVDVSKMDAEYFPAQAAWRNYLGPEDRNMSPKIKVVYSRPMKKDRDIFGTLVPYGKEWRMGANEASEITFYQSVDIGGTTVTPGTYTMSAVVNENDWVVNFSSQRGIWGSENRDASQTVASITVNPTMESTSVEALSMSFREMDEMTAHMTIQWDKTRVEIPIKFNPVIFSGADLSPMDMAHYPEKSAYTNYLKGEEVNMKPKIQVVYSRPFKKDRKVFGELLKTGDIWRVGANQSTEIVFYEDVMVGDLELKKGRYALYAEIKEGSWDMIFSKDLPAWGAANRDESKDVGRAGVTLSSDPEIVENLSIIFEEKSDKLVHMVIAWDTTRAEMPITFK